MTHNVSRRALLYVVLLMAFGIGTFLAPAPAEAICTTFHNSSLFYFYGDWACAYTGVACTECVASGSDCYHDSGSGLGACDFYPENRW